MYVHSSARAPFTFSWDGVRMTIQPGDTMEIPEGAARVIFGYEAADPAAVLASLGLIHNSSEVEKAMQFFRDFRVTLNAPEKPSAKADK